MTASDRTVTAFQGTRLVASGDLREVVLRARDAAFRDDITPILVFDDVTGAVVDVDLRRDAPEIAEPTAPAVAEPSSDTARRPGRPRLGVIPREVTLLPRHWEWLSSQRGGASVVLRRLVEHAMKASHGRDEIRRAQDATYRFVSAMAGNEPGYEEAIRALFASDPARFEAMVASWPRDVRTYAMKLAAGAFASSGASE